MPAYRLKSPFTTMTNLNLSTQGYSQLLLPSLDPIHIQRMNLVQGPESKVNIALNFMNIKMRGLSKAKLYKASGFNEPSKLDLIDFRFKTPKLMIDGPYSSKGRILVLPIDGKGISHMHLGMLGMLQGMETLKLL